jgi:tetratricopeptide (TPR) repeat protein
MNTVAQFASRPLFTRFLWKEYRMLRGFWLAGFGIALVIQGHFSSDILYTGKISDLLFLVAWGAAALYSVGAAITLFAAETEERTRDYLRLLPGDWKPMFASKVAVGAVSTMLLGLALSITGAWLEGWPTSREAEVPLGVAGVAAVEGLCWGLFFSLWWRQPLLAAVAAMACGSLGAQLAISFGTDSQDSWTAQAYANAAPARLLICLGVFAGAVLLGRRWFYPPSPTAEGPNEREESTARVKPLASKRVVPRTKMFSRLLWQTWHESWKSMLAGLLLGIIVFILLMIPIDLIPGIRDAWMIASLVPVAILGALVFRPDQQSDHRLFIATHAIPPRRMWWARQVVWLALIVTLGALANAFASWAFHYNVQWTLADYLRGDWGYTELLGREFENSDSPWTQWWRFERARELFNRGVLSAWCAIIAAYGAGQFCSMLLRQSLLAGFLAILFSIAIAGWSLLMFLWQMPPLVYVLPIGIAVLLATWLRTPSWVIGRDHFKHWLVPAALVIVPLALLIPTVPDVRSRQLQIPEPQYPFLKEPFAQMAGNFQAQHDAREEIGNQFSKLFADISWPTFADVMIENPSWLESGITEQEFESYQRGRGEGLLEDEVALMKRFEAAQNSLCAKRNQKVIQKLMALAERPLFSQAINQYSNSLADLLKDDAARLTAEGDLKAAWERLKALARFEDSLDDGFPYHEAILTWANQFDQNSEQIKSAIADLQQIFHSLPLPSESILRRYSRSRSIILETEPPPYEWTSPLLLLSNRLPGEQQRGLVALDRLTAQSLNYASAVVHLARGGTGRGGRNAEAVDNPRELIRMAPYSELYAIHSIAFNAQWASFLFANRLAEASATSFFAADILNHLSNLGWQLRNWANEETRRRATLIQLALLAYRIDHDEYPESLGKLKDYWPTMLSWNVNDPYSNKPFKYHPKGLEHPLKMASEKIIQAETPLLWSVGSANWKLLETFEYDPNDRIAKREFQTDLGQTVFKFIPQETDGHYSENLVFELP